MGRTPTSSARRHAVGRKIRETRREMGMTIDQLAYKSGVGWATLSRIERGIGNAEPTIDVMGKILKGLNAPASLSVWSLLRLAGYPEGHCNNWARHLAA